MGGVRVRPKDAAEAGGGAAGNLEKCQARAEVWKLLRLRRFGQTPILKWLARFWRFSARQGVAAI